MTNFSQQPYGHMIHEPSEMQRRLFPQYDGDDHHFDVVVVGSGMGGGIVADELADRFAAARDGRRVLVLEAGSYLVPTHVYNFSRFHNAEVARRYAVESFTQAGGETSQHYIHERPQMNLGGRSVWWSGLIPSLQDWELGFFPPEVRAGIAARRDEAGARLNASRTLGSRAREIVSALRASPLAEHFDIQETPRALHQPYLSAAGTPEDEFWVESTGVFNTAELLINQVEVKAGDDSSGGPLHVLLNHYVEAIARRDDGRYELDVTDVIEREVRTFTADVVVLAAGSLESPKIVRRSPVFDALPPASRDLVGRGLTDHPTTDSVAGLVTHLGNVAIPRDAHAKIIFYSRGHRDASGAALAYPFNIEMNVNHEYWHLRENDPSAPRVLVRSGHESIVDIKFSFGNVLDDDNALRFDVLTTPYVPEVRFKNLHWLDDLASNRFRLLAGWQKSFDDIWWVLNELTHQVFSQFGFHSGPARPEGWYGEHGRDFGYGTVHHAVGTLRMPFKQRFDDDVFSGNSVVDEDLMVLGSPNLYVCDMSVMPFAAAANPVRSLAALALRLSERVAAA